MTTRPLKRAKRRTTSTAKQRVLRRYPLAICVPWWNDERAYLISRDSAPFQDSDIGQGRTPQLAWLDAAIDAAMSKEGK